MGEYAPPEQVDGVGMKIALVVSRFNEHITGELLAGARRALIEHGVAADDLTVAWVPGAFELPIVAKKLALSGSCDAVVCLGAVIRGDTPHFDYVAGEAARGLQAAALDTGVPVVFGVLTTDTLQQAQDRIGGREGHKGEEAAVTALEMVELLLASPMTVYERIGHTYADTRKADPRIAAQIHAVLGGAERVLNVGAGTGNYEPLDRAVVALDPSPVMLAQRAGRAAPAVLGSADALPFPAGVFDAAMAILTLHHWLDLEAGIAEIRRVARSQVVLMFEPSSFDRFWLSDYFPEMRDLESERRAPSVERVVSLLGGGRVESVPVPADCTDGFGGCFWNRPERYLDPAVQRNTSNMAQLAPDAIARGAERLRRDLHSGEWDRLHGTLRHLDANEMGYRLIVAVP